MLDVATSTDHLLDAPDTDTSARLQQAALTRLSTTYCEKFRGPMITDEMVCAGTSGATYHTVQPPGLFPNPLPSHSVGDAGKEPKARSWAEEVI